MGHQYKIYRASFGATVSRARIIVPLYGPWLRSRSDLPSCFYTRLESPSHYHELLAILQGPTSSESLGNLIPSKPIPAPRHALTIAPARPIISATCHQKTTGESSCVLAPDCLSSHANEITHFKETIPTDIEMLEILQES